MTSRRLGTMLVCTWLWAGAAGAGYIEGMPYFHQYSNRIDPAGSCQNTCIAIVLKYYGAADITPDEISARWGTAIAQTTGGLESIFNEEAARRGLRVRDRATEDGTLAQLHAALDGGKPVIVHGRFSEVGHLLVLVGYDERYYYVMDPAGKWSERVNGGFTHKDDADIGRYTRYGRQAVEKAILSSDHRQLVRMHLLYFVEAPLTGQWLEERADSLVAGEWVHLRAHLRVQASGEGEVEVRADLSELGGAAEVPMREVEADLFALDSSFELAARPGRRALRAMLLQGERREVVQRKVVVLPRENAIVFADEMAPDWQQKLLLNARVRLQGDIAAGQGGRALAVEAQSFTLEFAPEEPLDLAGYRALRFWLHPGTASGGARPVFSVQLNSDVRKIETLSGEEALARLDEQRREWQLVEIPLWAFHPLEEPLRSIRFFGNWRGTFYLDDVQLVSARFPAPHVRAQWQDPLPDTLQVGDEVLLEQRLRLSSTEEGGPTPEVWADLSALGGPPRAVVESLGSGLYRLRVRLRLGGDNGRKALVVHVRQQGRERLLQTQLRHEFVLVPRADQIVYDEGYGDNWKQGFAINIETAPSREVAYAGSGSMQVRAQAFTLEYLPIVPVEAPGYRALRFAFRPGEVEGGARPSFNVMVNGDAPSMVSLVDGEGPEVDLARREWQLVEIPLERFHRLEGPIESIRLLGNLRGDFYLDDVRLVAARAETGRATAVLARQGTLPAPVVLRPNHPNPFNGETLIEFALPAPGPARLEIRDVLGQVVATLAAGELPAGWQRRRWDGRDQGGRKLASGVYFYHLQTPASSQVRKMLLLR